MRHVRSISLLAAIVLVCAAASGRSSSARFRASASPSSSDLAIQRALIDESNAALNAGDYAVARAKALEVVTYLLARTKAEEDSAWLALLNAAGAAAHDAQDERTASAAWTRVYEIRSATLPDDHFLLQDARQNLAATIHALGDLARARALREKVLEVHARTLPGDHPDLQKARLNLAATIYMQGDLAGSRMLEEQVLEVRSRTLPDDHPDLQTTRQNLSVTLYRLGDLEGARALFAKVLEIHERTLPGDHPDLQSARVNLATTLGTLGDLEGARLLQEKVLEVRSRTLPDDHPQLQVVRGNLARTLSSLGELARARALNERVLEVRSRTLPDDHPDLQAARGNVAATLYRLGDLAGARVMFERVLAVNSRTLPDDHPDLLAARENLASVLHELDDLAGARTLFEKVLEVRARELSDEHPDLLSARGNLAATLDALGDFAAARALFEKVLEVDSRTLPSNHSDLQTARENVAVMLTRFGDLDAARALEEKVLEVLTRTLPDEHPDLQRSRKHLALTIAGQVARSTGISGREAIGSGERGRERCIELIGALCSAQVDAARAAILESSGRQSEERCAILAKQWDVASSFALGFGVFGPLRELEAPVFEFAETTRGAAIASAQSMRRAASAPQYGKLRDALREAGEELAAAARQGTTSEEFDRLRVKRESVERELVRLAQELSGGKEVELDVESLARRLTAGEAAIAFRRFTKSRAEVEDELDSTGGPVVRETSVESLCAFVVRNSEPETKSTAPRDSAHAPMLTLIDLGPIAPIQEAVRAWREGLGVASDSRGVAISAREAPTSSAHAHGVELYERLFDPLHPVLIGIQRIVVVLDDVLHLVPLDALPIDEETLVGDRWRVETRTTLAELLASAQPFEHAGRLVAFGDVDYGTEPIRDEGESPITSDAAQLLAAAAVEPRTAERGEPATDAPPRAADRSGILRGSAWSQGFSALPGTGVEVRGIARCFADQFAGDVAPDLYEHASATRERLLELAPRARYLHIATHGWYAPESIQSWSDPEPIDEQSGLGVRTSGAEQVKGMSPMLLCGLALAGANSAEDAVGRVPGLVTADELSVVDLSNCELAVLSACDTARGEMSRAGQGVASLQKALQMAGARSVITSLWKVPDEATKELMLDFYRRLWVEKKPKHQALWEAKTKLREAKDERGEPKYTTRDWGAWVLTGDPD